MSDPEKAQPTEEVEGNDIPDEEEGQTNNLSTLQGLGLDLVRETWLYAIWK